jgi:PKD repeat protein
MRSIPLLAATSVILIGAWGCGSDSGVGPNDPVANFTAGACTVGTPCQFTNTSTPATGLTYEWDFGDGTPKVTDASPAHTFATAGDKSVSLKVTNASGATNTKTSTVPVAAGTNQPPTASFTLPATCNAGTPCGFHSTSSDADGQVTTSHWDFGDQSGTTDTPGDATHTYQNPGTYTVTLTVTDNGGATSTPATQQLIVSAPASQSCTTSGTLVNCSVVITQNTKVRITLLSRACELGDNKVMVTVPTSQLQQTAFTNLCFAPLGQEYIVKDAPGGADFTFTAGQALGIQFRQGAADPGDPATGDPGIRVSGSFPNITLNIDDGGNAAGQGEPDFDDAVLLIQPAP